MHLFDSLSDEHPLPPGMPQYIASGSHIFSENRYRFLILQRFKWDLHSIIKKRRVNPKHALILANQIIDVLEHLHDKGYAHSDIKAENLMIGSCTYDESAEAKRVQAATNTGISLCSTPLQGKSKVPIEWSGSNPVRSCRMKNNDLDVEMFADFGKPYSMRTHKQVSYKYNDDDIEIDPDDTDDEDFCVRSPGLKDATPKKRGRPQKGTLKKQHSSASSINTSSAAKFVTEDRIFLIDFGLASKFIDSTGVHHPFCMDQRRAHDGTLEFTSRDAHMGAHSRRSDLECLGYNLMYWTLGSLPWKDEKLLNQPEHVHRMKEIFMTDAREMLKLIYGQQVPNFLGDYLHYVNDLAYDERPNYDYLRSLFQSEFTQMGLKKSEMVLNLSDLKRGCIDVKKSPKSQDNRSDKIHNVKSIAKLGLLLPIKERMNNSRNSSFGSRISPKNLRSKADKIPKKQRSRFSWAEILSQDPDQIARQRAEKEFERDQMSETPNKYKGRPTYAILEIENKLKSKDNNNESRCFYEENDYIKGYTKTMMEIVRKRKASLLLEQAHKKEEAAEQKIARRGRRKSANPTKLVKTNDTRTKHHIEEIHNNFYIRPKRKNEAFSQQLTPPPSTTDESSCSSNASSGSDAISKPTIKRATAINAMNNFPRKRAYAKKSGSTGSSRSLSHSSIASTGTAYTASGISSSVFFDDEDSRDTEDFNPVRKQYKKQGPVTQKRRGRPPGSGMFI